MKSRGFRAANEITNAVKEVLRGSRSGRQYRKRGGGIYTASAPGEAPAVRTGGLRSSFKRRTYARHSARGIHVHAIAESGLKVGKYLLGDLLDGGTKKMAKRPFKEKTLQLAQLKVERIFDEPYI